MEQRINNNRKFDDEINSLPCVASVREQRSTSAFIGEDGRLVLLLTAIYSTAQVM